MEPFKKAFSRYISMKICTKCEEELPLENFSKRGDQSDGLATQCKSCVKDYKVLNQKRFSAKAKIRYEATKHLLDKDKLKVYKRGHYIKNSEAIKLKAKLWREANLDKKAFTSATRRAKILQRTPPWLTEEDFSIMRAYYRVAKKLTEVTGEPYHVDHIIPLQGKLVSGFHCPSNLQVLKGSDNCSKGNSFTPH